MWSGGEKASEPSTGGSHCSENAAYLLSPVTLGEMRHEMERCGGY